MRHPSLARGRARPAGVIDTFTAGYEVVNRHPWIVLIPILLDVFLWLGPQFSAAPLVSRALSGALGIGPSGTPLRLDQAQVRDIVGMVDDFNLLSVLTASVVGVPSLVAALGVRDPLRSIPVQSWGSAVGLLLGALLGGLLLGSLYYSLVAQGVRGEARSAARLLGGIVRAWTRVLLYLLLLGGIGLLFGLPISFLAASAALVDPRLGSLAASAVMMGIVWSGIYLFFVPDAIFLSQVGPLAAIKQSVALVRANFWGAIGLIGLTFVILLGTGIVWRIASESLPEPWGTGFGILGNAYIASGVIAAGMRFYRERTDVPRTGPGSPPPNDGAVNESKT